MTEAVAEKLAQKVTNALEEMADLNLLVRRLPPAQETQNRIYERVDATHGILKTIEQGISLADGKIRQLEEQAKVLHEGFRAIEQMDARIGSLIGDVASGIEAVRARISDLKNDALSEQDGRRQLSAVITRHFSAIRLTQWVIGFLIVAAILLILLRS